MAVNLVNDAVYGRDSNPTIYYLVGHAGKIKQYGLHIRYLVSHGFRVVAFDYDPKVLICGDPQRLLAVLTELQKRVSTDMPNRTVAGIYGISLGTFLGMNIMAENRIQRGMFNTGPANLVGVIWDITGFAPVKTAFKDNGVSRQELEASWESIELPAIIDRLQDTEMLCLNSYDDDIITKDNWQKAFDLLTVKGINAQLITTRRYGHVGAIIRNLFRLRAAKNFFKK